jgi:hypothetical protein
MRYIFATTDTVVRSTLEAGSLLLVFPPEEQALAYQVMCGIIGLTEADELREIAKLLRTEHDKQEEN